MADAEVKRHDTKHLDRHNDYIAVYQRGDKRPVFFSDGGEAIEDLFCRVPETTTPEDRARVICEAIKATDEWGCWLQPVADGWVCWLQSDMAIITTARFDPDLVDDEASIANAIERVAQAYLAVDRIDVEEVLARE